MHIFIFKKKIKVYLFILRETEHEQGRGREGEKESQSGSMLSAQPNAGLKFMNHEIMTCARSQTLNDPATQVPLHIFHLFFFFFTTTLLVFSLHVSWHILWCPKFLWGSLICFLSVPQIEKFLSIYFQVHWFFSLPAQVYMWAPVVKTAFQ